MEQFEQLDHRPGKPLISNKQVQNSHCISAKKKKRNNLYIRILQFLFYLLKQNNMLACKKD